MPKDRFALHHRPRHLLKLLQQIAIILLALVSAPGRANQMTTWATLDATYSDNANRRPKASASEDIWYTPGISTDYLLSYPDFNASLKYHITKTFYQKHVFRDRTDVLGEGSFKWSLINKRLYWDFFQTRKRLTIDSLITSIPNNQTDRDVIKTGPILQLNFSALNQLTVAAHYIRSSFNTNQLFTSHQREFSSTYLHSMSNGNTQWGLSATFTRSLSDSDSLKYVSRRYGLVSHGNGKRLHYDLEIGRNTISTAGIADISSLYYNLSIAIVGKSSSFSIFANRELTDSVMGLALSGVGLQSSLNAPVPTGGNDFTANPGGNLNLAGIVDRRHYLTGYHFEGGRTSLDVTLFYNRTSYWTLTRNQNSRNLQIQSRFRFSSLTSIGYRLRWSDQLFERSSATQADQLKETSHRIDFSYTPNRRFSLEFWIGHRIGHYMTNARDFTETEGGISLKQEL